MTLKLTRDHPNVVAWHISNFSERFDAAICNDKWISNPYTFDHPTYGRIEFYLKFCPIKDVSVDKCSLFVSVSKCSILTSIVLDCKAWVEDKYGTRSASKSDSLRFGFRNSWGWPTFLATDELKPFRNASSIFACIELSYKVEMIETLSIQSALYSWKIDDFKTRVIDFLALNGNNPKYGDVEVRTKDGKTFQTQKLVLCAMSDVFRAMFDNPNTVESQTNTIKLEDLESKVVKPMLEFIQTGKVENINEVDSALYVVADRYELTGLQMLCLQSMKENFSLDTILDYLELAFTYDKLAELKRWTIDYVVKNFEGILELNEWTSFASAHLPIVSELIRTMGRRLKK